MPNFLSLLSILGIAILPSLIWLFFYLKEDLHPEPKYWIFVIFLLGVSVAPLVVFFETILVNFFTLTLGLTALKIGILIVVVAPLVEEVAKYAVVHLALNRNLVFDEPVDSMIYLIVSALGFAAIENILATFSIIQLGPEGFIQKEYLFKTIDLASLRFFSAVALHALASGIVGYFFAKYYFSETKKAHYIFQGLGLAILLHGLYNFLIMLKEDWSGAIFLLGLVLGGAASILLWLFYDLKHKPRKEPKLPLNKEIDQTQTAETF